MKRIIISESQSKRFLFNEMMGDGFSLKELDRLPDLQQKQEYCEKYLGEPFGQGGTRYVFELTEGRILKLAHGYKDDTFGLEQNHREWLNFEHYSGLKNSSANDSENKILNDVASLFPKCFAHAKDWSWIIVEEVFQIHKDDFLKVLGIRFQDDKVYFPQQQQPNKGYKVSGLKKKAIDYANKKVNRYCIDNHIYSLSQSDMSELHNIFIEEYYAQFGLHMKDDIATDYSMYPNADSQVALNKADGNGRVGGRQPNLMNFVYWAICKKMGINPYYPQEICDYYEELPKNNPWFKAFYFYITSLNDNDLVFDNFGLALRNGKPWIVILDSGYDKSNYNQNV